MSQKKIMMFSLIIYILLGCKGNITKFNRENFIQGFETCFNDKAFFVIGNFVKDDKYYVYTNYHLTDKINIKGINFYINPSGKNNTNNPPINITLKNISKTEITFILNYPASQWHHLKRRLSFNLINSKWVIKDLESTIIDVDFKEYK